MEPVTSAAAIELLGIAKSFGQVQAVRGIDLDIAQGEVVAFLGPNGAGKTSTIDMILGLSRPTEGSVRVLGLEPHEAIARGLVSAVMQTGGLLKDLTVRETVEYTAAVFRGTAPGLPSVDEVIGRAGIDHIADRTVGKCSGGEQQRLRFALALVSEPALLLLDEPTTGMDVEGRRSFWAAIRADAERGRTVLFATHYLDEADAYADRIVLMAQGRIVADGSAAEIKAMAAGRSVRAQWETPDLPALELLPGVERVEQQGDMVVVHASDTDAVARYLLTQTNAKNLEIATKALEEAFVALTGPAGGTDQ